MWREKFMPRNKENKLNIIREDIKNGKSCSNFYDVDFAVFKSGWDRSGVHICTNCKSETMDGLGIDWSIINSFDIDEMNKFMSDLSYLKALTERRIADITKSEDILELDINRYKRGNKKLCDVSIVAHNVFTDGYLDEALTKYKTVEKYTFSDTKNFQRAIEDKINELVIKYNIKSYKSC